MTPAHSVTGVMTAAQSNGHCCQLLPAGGGACWLVLQKQLSQLDAQALLAPPVPCHHHHLLLLLLSFHQVQQQQQQAQEVPSAARWLAGPQP